jgi:lipid-binding SYLF domain-containing protein
MKLIYRISLGAVLVMVWAALSEVARADDNRLAEAQQTVDYFLKVDPDLKNFFNNAVGYAVFPGVGKGAAGIGAAHGKGLVYEKGELIGEASMTQITIGFQLGGQSYSELIFFESPATLESFKRGEFALSAQVSAVAAASGASANAKYQRGVAVFTMPRNGLMYEASVGGQKFSFEPLLTKTNGVLGMRY